MFIELFRSGNFLIVLINTFARLPSPGPSSTKLKFLGLPSFSHTETTHTVIISENKFEIVGAVIKSPCLPNGILFV